MMTKEEIIKAVGISEETLELIIEINEGNAIKVLTDLEKMAKAGKKLGNNGNK